MDFFNKFSETITNKSKDVANKAKEIAEVTSLTGKIATQENLIEKYYKEIGRFVYEHREEACDNGLEERFKLVDAAYEEIERLKSEIRKIKGVKLCESCKAEVPAEAAFCHKCGTAVPEEVPAEVEAEAVRDVTEAETVDEEAVEQVVEEAVEETVS
ncbi:MAG: zinc ribbon domain-containing protein [Lachnospiraceae bacterium]|nr:zinc ribbon domain-containing protein [Lachnospiraceae bacterium]